MEFQTITAGEAVLTLVPGIGGAVVSWMRAGKPILRPPLPDAINRKFVRGLGAFPLVPYSNRIAKGRFTFAGTQYRLPATFDGNAIHGVGWQSAWHATRPDASRITLTLDHLPDIHWPFAFRSEQRYVLTEDMLIVHILVQSLHGGPAPAGIGLHPYFARSRGTTLQFVAGAVWENGPDMIPTRRIAVPPAWNHSSPRPVGSVTLDHCFGGWRGTARIAYPDRGMAVAIEAEPIFRHLVVFVPPDKDFFAIEPVTNMNDGVNRMDDTAGHGVTILQPGETLAGRMHFRIEPLVP